MAIRNHVKNGRAKPIIASAGYTGKTRTYGKGGNTKRKPSSKKK